MEDVKIHQNKTILIGTLLRDPEIKTYGDRNQQYARISIMTTIKGSKSFNNLITNKETIINDLKSCKKDDTVRVVARLMDKKYINQNGEKRSKIEIFPYEIKKQKVATINENQVDLMGRLVSKPEKRPSKTGKDFVIVSLAVANKKSKAGEGDADFFSFKLWDKDATNALALDKAEWVEFRGIIRNSSYEKDGQKVYTTELIPDLFRKKIWEDRSGNTSSPNQNDNNDVYDDIDMGFMTVEPVDDGDMPFNF